MAPTLAILNEQQVRELARIINLQESAATQNITFASEDERVKYMTYCKANYESVIGLLDGVVELKSKFQSDVVRASIAHDIYSYVVYDANSALQTVPNYTLRKSYLKKITEHVTSLTTALQLQQNDPTTNLELLAKEAAHYKDAMLDYLNKYRSCSASSSFSQWIKDTGMSFQELVQMFQNKLNLEGRFQDLKETQKIQVYDAIIDASERTTKNNNIGFQNKLNIEGRSKDLKKTQKLQVYDEIIEASGRGRNSRIQLLEEFDKSGAAVLLFKAGKMAWDVFSSDNILKEATRVAVTVAASAGGEDLGTIVGVALAIELTGAEASIAFVVTAGIVGGIAGAFLIGAFAGWMFDLIFSSGGNAPLSTEGLLTYVAPLPDGVAIAYQLSHQIN